MTKKMTVAAAQKRAFNAAMNNIVFKLDGLSSKCAEWEGGVFKTANEALYGLLAECKDIYDVQFLNASDEVKVALRKELIKRLIAAGLRVVKSTTTLQLLVRYTFKSDRRRAHVYAYVLRAAVSDNIAGDQLADYIRAAGGIEEIRGKQVLSEQALKKRAEVAAAVGGVMAEIERNAARPLGVIAAPVGEDLGKFCVVLGMPNGDGTISLVSVLSDVSDAMLRQFNEKVAKVRIAQNAEKTQVRKEVGVMQEPAADNCVAEEELLAA